MKKLMTIAAAACAMSAFAETKDLEGGYYLFEDPVLEEGQEAPIADATELQDGYWIGMDGAESSVLKAYAAGETPAKGFSGLTPDNQYLHIETDGSTLSRAFTDPAQWAGSEEGKPGSGTPDVVDFGTVFVDTAMKFTPTDTDPQIEEGAQFALWLKAVDGGDDTPGYTNLMVTCGSIDDFGFVNPINVALDIDIEPESWHRVTVKPVLESTWGYEQYPGLGGFLIYIDKKLVAAKDYSGVLTSEFDNYGFEDVLEYAEKGQFFPSLLKYDIVPAQLTSIGFSGTGDIDMLNITDEDPIQPIGDGFEVTWLEPKGATVVATVNGEEIDSGDVIAAETEILFTATPSPDFEYATEPDGWELQVDGSITATFTVVDENLAVEVPAPTEVKQEESWDIPEEDINKPAQEVWTSVPENLADVPAGKLATWAKANSIKFGDEFTQTMVDGYLLDCAPDAVEEEAKTFKIESIEFIDGQWVVKVVGDIADGDAYTVNAKVEVEEITLPGTNTETSKFWQAKLVPITAEK